MSAAEALAPKLFLARHGETEWAKIGRFTGVSEIPLNAFGEAQVARTGSMLIGPDKLINPTRLTKVYISPRKRAQDTFTILFSGDEAKKWAEKARVDGTVQTTDALAEWGYGDYEGLYEKEIRELRHGRGHDKERPWNIWRDGCEGPGSEDADTVAKRLDALIEEIKDQQRGGMKGEIICDIMVVAHGHLLRAFTKRWLKMPLNAPLHMILPPGGIGILSYVHGDIEQPAFYVGMGFPPPER